MFYIIEDLLLQYAAYRQQHQAKMHFQFQGFIVQGKGAMYPRAAKPQLGLLFICPFAIELNSGS